VLHFTYRDFTNRVHLEKTEVPASRDHPSYFVHINPGSINSTFEEINYLNLVNKKESKKTERERERERERWK
jgi:hypothetical protein